MNFANGKSITIPEGDVKRVAIGGVTVWEKPNPLPYDAEVEYVESTGAQYVDTGIPATSGLRIAMSLGTTSSQTGMLFGARDSSRVGLFVGLTPEANRNFRLWYGGSQTYDFNVSNWGGIDFAVTDNSLSYNGRTVVVSGQGEFATQLSMYVFGFNNNGKASSYRKMALKGMSITDSNGVLVRDLVPCRVGTAGALYDRANPTGGPLGNGLYGSATSTPLVAGPDVNGGAA